MSVEQKIEAFEIKENNLETGDKELQEIVDRISNEIANMYNSSHPVHPLYELQYYNNYLAK